MPPWIGWCAPRAEWPEAPLQVVFLQAETLAELNLNRAAAAGDVWDLTFTAADGAVARAYVRREVPDDAELTVGEHAATLTAPQRP